MKKVKVLYLIATLTVGGAERQLVELVKRLPRDRFEPLVCCLTCGGPLVKEVKEAGIKIVILNKRFKVDPIFFIRLVGLIKRERPVIVHTYMFTANFCGRLAGLLAGVPVIISAEHCMVYPYKNFLQRFFDRILAKFTTRIIAASESIRLSLIKKEKIPFSKVITIKNGIDLEKYKRVGDKVLKRYKEEFGLKGKVVIGTIGRLEHFKGYEYFLEAAEKVLRKAPETIFILVGNGSLKNRLKKLAKRLKIEDKVIFTGYRNDVVELLSLFNIFILPSLSEGLSNLLLEAMACGKPIIATDIAANREIITNGEDGILVPPKDSENLAKAILKVYQDSSLLRKIGGRARKRVESSYNIENTAKKSIREYEISLG